jgi:hypothetical protein
MNHSMTWSDFYLICFAVGFCFSFFSFVFGGSRYSAGQRGFTVQLRHAHRVPGLVWRHGVSAYALLRPLGRLWIAGFRQQRAGWWKHCVCVPEQGFDLGRRKHGPGRLRNGGRAGSSLQFNPRRWDGRNHLYADGNAAGVRCAQR